MPPINQTAFRQDLTKERMLPPSDLIPTRTTIEQLKIPDEVALKAENVVPFLASQAIRYNEIVNRPDIKTLAAEIPEYVHEDNSLMCRDSLNVEEREALSSYVTEKAQDPTFLSANGLESLKSEIEEFIRVARREHPEDYENSSDPKTIDPFEVMFTNQLAQESEEEETRWRELLVAARDPEMLSLVIGARHSKQIVKNMGKIFESHRFQTQQLDRLRAAFDLKSSKGNLSTVDIAKFNADMTRITGDRNTANQAFLHLLSEYDRNIRFISDIRDPIRRAKDVMVANLKTG